MKAQCEKVSALWRGWVLLAVVAHMLLQPSLSWTCSSKNCRKYVISTIYFLCVSVCPYFLVVLILTWLTKWMCLKKKSCCVQVNIGEFKEFKLLILSLKCYFIISDCVTTSNISGFSGHLVMDCTSLLYVDCLPPPLPLTDPLNMSWMEYVRFDLVWYACVSSDRNV